MNHVMLDFETMGTIPESALVSIGAVQFDPLKNVVDTKNVFYREMDYENQNRFICPKTSAWWREQSDDAKTALQGLDDIKITLLDFKAWCPPETVLWGNGSRFDLSLLDKACRCLEIDVWWKFWNEFDVRTIKWICEAKKWRSRKVFKGTKHNALDDAISQAEDVCHWFNALTLVQSST